ncbi:tyrosine-type recombinase/integrase [Halomonas halocynthiae]|uniref:tyrosine-type recombinase/integrase n=1 Tax=Halomonas halocynthiae TaxID=176290 RepID=UPI00041227EE|nr:tyrosine-type recombinase/integrase [Halomonas halocynthiae]
MTHKPLLPENRDGCVQQVGLGDVASRSVIGSPRISAASDIEAVSAWLMEYRATPNTQRAYRREAERLLLWMADTQYHAKPLSLTGLRRDQLAVFEQFLADPQPAERWIGPVRPRNDSRWRPFRGPLSPASRRQSLVILQGMYAWLTEAGWVDHNPFRLMRDKRRRLDNRSNRVERYLERPLWDWLWQWLNTSLHASATPRQQFEAQRRRIIFGFAYLLAPRLGEMAAARMNDFFMREGRWWWRVVGKGSKLATIPVPPDMCRLLEEWRAHLGLSGMPKANEATPLLRGMDKQRAIGDNQLYRLIRDVFQQAAVALEESLGCNAKRDVAMLLRATPHWLRHTALTHQAQAGVELRYLAENARHARLDTTARYLHTEDEQWHEQQSRHGLSPMKQAEHGFASNANSGADEQGNGPL